MAGVRGPRLAWLSCLCVDGLLPRVFAGPADGPPVGEGGSLDTTGVDAADGAGLATSLLGGGTRPVHGAARQLFWGRHQRFGQFASREVAPALLRDVSGRARAGCGRRLARVLLQGHFGTAGPGEGRLPDRGGLDVLPERRLCCY